MKVYRIKQTNMLNITLAELKTKEEAEKRLEEIKKTDLYLQKVYAWRNLPTYTIVEEEK